MDITSTRDNAYNVLQINYTKQNQKCVSNVHKSFQIVHYVIVENALNAMTGI